MRNFYCHLLWVTLFSQLSVAEDWVELFDGTSLEGWTERNKSGSFRVEDGAIIGTAKEGLGTTFLCTNESYGDFELEFHCKLMDPELNSGVQIRSRNREPKGKQTVGPVEGPQIEIAAKNPEKGSFSGNIFGQGWGAWLTPKESRKNHAFFVGGAWNAFRVLAQGDQVTVWINGNEVIKTSIPSERHETHPSGFIGLQIHGIKEGTGPYEVAWKDIRVRERNEEDLDQEGGANVSTTTEPIRLRHPGPEKPFRSLPEFRDHDLSFFAMAPEINCPVSVVAEPGGAVYALCDGNAGLGRLPNQGRVYRLIDEDDDGKADMATKFIPDIDTPRGGHFLGDTLYLVHPPHISSFRDLDGDGVADEHKVLASGFGHDIHWKRGGDHTTNDLRVGIDGWIYVALGDFGADAVGSDGSRVTMMRGGVIRMRKDGSDLEVYARGTRNTYDLAINHRLDILAMDNTNDGDGWDMRLHHLTPLAHMGYPNLFKYFHDDAMLPLFVYGGGSGCGALYLEEPGFPDWINKRFHTISWGRMYTHDLTPHEATFVNRDEVTFSLNKLVDLDVDGSSRLYFSSFENGGARIQPGAIVGHLIQAKPHGWKKRAFPDLSASTVEELISYLDQGSAVLRQNAQWALIEHEDANVSAALRSAAEGEAFSVEARIAALYAINLRGEEGSADLVKAFLADEVLQEFALRALLDREDRGALALEPILARGLASEDPRVVLHAVAGAQKVGLRESTEMLVRLSQEGPRLPLEKGVAHVHEVIPHTARRALILMAPVEELHQVMEKPKLREPALAALRQIHTKENVDGLISKLASSGSGESLDLVATLLRL
ncbi:MAG: family 16 glycoside hydrolase, partial [Verrucomicrobiota bacterium]